MLKSLLFISVFSFCFQANVKTGNARVQDKSMAITALPTAVKKMVTDKKLYLLIPEKNHFGVRTDKTEYIQCYLVNNTGKDLQIKRADGCLDDVSCEIQENDKWVLYQQSVPVTCGNSWWSQTLANGQALVVQYDFQTHSNATAMLRLKLGTTDPSVYSNTVMALK